MFQNAVALLFQYTANTLPTMAIHTTLTADGTRTLNASDAKLIRKKHRATMICSHWLTTRSYNEASTKPGAPKWSEASRKPNALDFMEVSMATVRQVLSSKPQICVAKKPRRPPKR